MHIIMLYKNGVIFWLYNTSQCGRNAMTDFIVSTFGIKELYGRVMHGNNASVKVLEKNGYVFVKEEFEAEDDPYGNGMLIYKKEY